MTFDLVPQRIWTRFPAFLDEDDEVTPFQQVGNNISIFEDDKHIYVEAALPGVNPAEIEMTFDRGVLWIKGEVKEEEQKKKYYKKAATSFSYRVVVPGDIDTSIDPVATTKHGIMQISFAKVPQTQPKKITIKEA